MIINRDKRWVVITPPKTGSCTLNRLLTTRPFGGTFFATDWHHNTDVPPWAADFAVYLSVRDPFARASSLYRYQSRDLYLADPIRSFTEWVQRALIGRERGPYYWQTLEQWYPGPARPIHLESLAEDLQRLEPSGRFVIPCENPDPRLEHWCDVYDREPAAWSLVREWARADCGRFGYDLR